MKGHPLFVLICCFIFIGCLTQSKKEKAENAHISRILEAAGSELSKSSPVVFYADLSKPSGSYRFFIIDLRDSTILDKGLCCNGRTDASGKVLFSNAYGSQCSSEGMYRIGNAYSGNFGKAFKLHGLSPTNSNAFNRFIVLHAYWKIPRRPMGIGIVKSEGCPTVNPEFLDVLGACIEKAPKPTLLFIF